MKRILIITSCLAFLASCGNSTPKDLSQYTVDYSIEDNRYGVVVAEDDGISTREAKNYAMQRAAQVAHSHGYRYFTIDRETQVLMTKGSNAPYNEDMPKNLYYSMIQSDNFGKDRMDSSNLTPTEQVPGYQIEFSCQGEKPSGRSHDVCDYGLCN